MKVAFAICIASIAVLYIYLLTRRMSVERMKERMDELQRVENIS